MGSFFVKMFEMLLEGNKEKRQSTLFHLKSFVFLCLILVLFTSRAVSYTHLTLPTT